MVEGETLEELAERVCASIDLEGVISTDGQVYLAVAVGQREQPMLEEIARLRAIVAMVEDPSQLSHAYDRARRHRQERDEALASLTEAVRQRVALDRNWRKLLRSVGYAIDGQRETLKRLYGGSAPEDIQGEVDAALALHAELAQARSELARLGEDLRRGHGRR